MCAYGSIWELISIGLANDLVPKSLEAIIWTNYVLQNFLIIRECSNKLVVSKEI